MTFPDPFSNDDPRFEPYQLPAEQPELGQLDHPASGLLEFLREETRARAKRQIKPQPPQAEPWRLGHIKGSPN
jgi:hypothetical protein